MWCVNVSFWYLLSRFWAGFWVSSVSGWTCVWESDDFVVRWRSDPSEVRSSTSGLHCFVGIGCLLETRNKLWKKVSRLFRSFINLGFDCFDTWRNWNALPYLFYYAIYFLLYHNLSPVYHKIAFIRIFLPPHTVNKRLFHRVVFGTISPSNSTGSAKARYDMTFYSTLQHHLLFSDFFHLQYVCEFEHQSVAKRVMVSISIIIFSITELAVKWL